MRPGYAHVVTDLHSSPRTGGAVVRPARPGDEHGILALIHALAVYEREPDAVANTAGMLAERLFGDEPRVFAHVADDDGEIVGIAIWFVTYSTWTGKHGLWLEDLYVDESRRGTGLGKSLMRALAGVDRPAGDDTPVAARVMSLADPPFASFSSAAERARFADQPRQTLRSAVSRDQTQFDLGQPQFGVLTGETERAGKGQLKAPTERKAIDGGHRRKRKLLQFGKCGLAELCAALLRGHGSPAQLLDIRTGTERLLAGPCNNKRPDVPSGGFIDCG